MQLLHLITTINNINVAFSNCLQMRYNFTIFINLVDLLVGKVTMSTNSTRINFPEVSEQAPFKHQISCSVYQYGSTTFALSLVALLIGLITIFVWFVSNDHPATLATTSNAQVFRREKHKKVIQLLINFYILANSFTCTVFAVSFIGHKKALGSSFLRQY